MADKGTAFIDEIGELPAPLQSKLLRVIQEQTFVPLGKSTPQQIDARFICATNRDLELEVNAGRFRRDLFYRLAVIHVHLPPLRQRGNDITLLTNHFLQQLPVSKVGAARFSDEALELLQRYPWPGNIRELRNAVEHGLAMARSETINVRELPATLQRAALDRTTTARVRFSSGSRADALDGAERDYLIALLRENHGNVARSATQAGMSRQGLHKLLKKHGIQADEYRQ